MPRTRASGSLSGSGRDKERDPIARRTIRQRIRSKLEERLGVTALRHRVDVLEQRLLESAEETWDRSRRRWRDTAPNEGLTWGKELSGDTFVEAMAAHGAFAEDRAVLEIGPGYGRLLKAVLKQGRPFSRYVGVDLSEKNVEFLRGELGRDGIEFVNADAETVALDGRFDVVMSSLTLKHLYPSFRDALANVARHLNPGAVVFFDLIEGSRRGFDLRDGVTWIRWYERDEVLAILEDVGLEHVEFDEVRHSADPKDARLLVVARRPGRPAPRKRAPRRPAAKRASK